MVLHSIPSHSIHTIHGTLSGFPSGHKLSNNKVLEAIVPPPRTGNIAPQRIAFPSKSMSPPPLSESKSDSEELSWKVVRRPTKGSPRRAPPPPPPKRVVPPPTEVKSDDLLDPFADEATDYITLVDATPVTMDLTSSYSPPIEIHIQPTPASPEPISSVSILYQPPGLSTSYSEEQQRVADHAAHAARLKFVAAMVMNRVHCHVRPLRRRAVLDPWLNPSMKRAYVRSGLSRMVAVDAE
ncbi:hypothetical protein OE88DRAFT_1073130 [Heliocybe sulcata]|uniref:Uncharacterized protein n=1 Tax=Heliocybe sulcata TaxID=5364 RepID=A0A5C3MNJ5_9AGAM|nr:hypothetical protein OE88DRAFT_1073130 [Heliocybe sulcata]